MIYDKLKWVLIYILLSSMIVGMYYLKYIRIYGYTVIEANSFILGCLTAMVYLFEQRKSLKKTTLTKRRITIILSYPFVFSFAFIPIVGTYFFHRMTMNDNLAQLSHFSVSLFLVIFYTIPLILFRNDSITVNVIAFPVSLYIVATIFRLVRYSSDNVTINIFALEIMALSASLFFIAYLFMIRRYSGLFFERKTRKTSIF